MQGGRSVQQCAQAQGIVVLFCKGRHRLLGVASTLFVLHAQRPFGHPPTLLPCSFICRARGAPLYDSDFEEMYGGSAGAPLLGGDEADGVDEAREEVEATFGHAFHADQPGLYGAGAKCRCVCTAEL